MKKIIIVFILSLFLIGCNVKNDFSGTYYYSDNDELKDNIAYTFKDDNTGIYVFNKDSRSFTYSINENKLKIIYDDKSMKPLETIFKLENNTLKFKNSFGEDVTYKKR